MHVLPSAKPLRRTRLYNTGTEVWPDALLDVIAQTRILCTCCLKNNLTMTKGLRPCAGSGAARGGAPAAQVDPGASQPAQAAGRLPDRHLQPSAAAIHWTIWLVAASGGIFPSGCLIRSYVYCSCAGGVKDCCSRVWLASSGESIRPGIELSPCMVQMLRRCTGCVRHRALPIACIVQSVSAQHLPVSTCHAPFQAYLTGIHA